MSIEPHVIVTGGAGFIGSHLVERLLADDKAVTVIDDFSTGSMTNLQLVREHPKLRIVHSKLSECAQLPQLVESAESIYHLAAVVGVDLVMNAAVRTIETNVLEMHTILSVASRFKTPLIFTSTSEVYGKSAKAEFSEADDLLIGPPHLGRWSYACSKLMDEFLALAYAREQGLPIVIARLFNTVGPRQTGRYGMVVPRFISAAQKGRPLQVFGDGKQTRCFCYVKDTVEALIRLQNCPEARGEVFNVGNDEEISIRELAELIVKTLDASSSIELVSYGEAHPPGFEDMVRRRPNLEKLVKTINFQPLTPLRVIIELSAAVV